MVPAAVAGVDYHRLSKPLPHPDQSAQRVAREVVLATTTAGQLLFREVVVFKHGSTRYKKARTGQARNYFVYIIDCDKINLKAVSAQGKAMDDITRIKCLTIVMMIIGLFFTFAIYPLMEWWWPEGWGWTPRQPEYEYTIIGTYATLGVFLLLAAKHPIANLVLVWLVIWLSLVHATISLLLFMLAPDQVLEDNLIGEIPAQYLIAGVLWYLIPKNIKLLQRLHSDSE